MITKYVGACYTYGGTTYRIGDRVVAVKGSPYEGLFGTIFEIRDGADKETDNETPDIYCEFMPPVLPEAIERLKGLFTEEHLHPKSAEDIMSDLIIMAPEMIQVLPEGIFSPQLKLYLVKSHWTNRGEPGEELKIALRPEIAQCYFTGEVTDIILEFFPDWEALGEIEVDAKKDSYECWVHDQYFENHFKVVIQELEIPMYPEFLELVGRKYVDEQLRKHFAEQIEGWEELEGLSDQQIHLMVTAPHVPERIRKQLKENGYLIESYWESVSEAAFALVKGFIDNQTGTETAGGNGQ